MMANDFIPLLLDKGFDDFLSGAAAWAKARGVTLPQHYYTLEGAMRARAFTVSGLSNLDQVQRVVDGLNDALAKGQSFTKWQEVAKAVDYGLSKNRLDLIYRNHTQNAYMAGHWNAIIEHKAERPYLMYSAINDSRTRPAHRAMHGVIRPIDDAFWQSNYPPNGHRCRCSAISVTTDIAMERGGVTQNIPENARADKGWDYHPKDADKQLQKLAYERSNQASPAMAAAFSQWLRQNGVNHV